LRKKKEATKVAAKTFTELLKDAPKNWGRWGADDEIGALNFLTGAEVLRGVSAVKQGKVFALGVSVAWPGGDPIYPGRGQPTRTMAEDCAKDGQYTFLFVGAPLKVVGGAGSPVNPLAIK
jgi:hypothetical protein